MILETELLVLREFEESDLEAVQLYASDPDVVRYMDFGPNTENDTRHFLQIRLQQQSEKPRRSYDFPLMLKHDGNLIGACGIYISQPENKGAEIGYVLNKHYWNQGYATEAAKVTIRFGFQHLGLHRIYAYCHPVNVASYRVMEKIGMEREGHLRQHKFVKGEWRDSLLYSILEQEVTFTQQKS